MHSTYVKCNQYGKGNYHGMIIYLDTLLDVKIFNSTFPPFYLYTDNYLFYSTKLTVFIFNFFLKYKITGMFLSMSMEEPNEPLVCNVDGGGRRGGAGSSRSNDDDSSVSMPDSGSSAGSEHDGGNSGALPPNGHMAGLAGSGLGASGLGGGHGGGMAGVLLSAGLGESGHGAAGLTAGQLKRRPTSPGDDPRRQSKRAKHGTSTMLLSLMQVNMTQRISYYIDLLNQDNCIHPLPLIHERIQSKIILFLFKIFFTNN